MKKNVYNWLLTAALVCGLSLHFVACTDNDEDGGTSGTSPSETIAGDPYGKTGEEAAALYMVMNQLAGVDSLPDNWREAEFEPTEGLVADPSQPYVRTVVVMDLTEAQDLFRSYTGRNFDHKASTVKWKSEAVGTMTLNVLNHADCIATIDMQLRQMPHLVQLRMVPPSAVGDNALKKVPYYRIGDVVQDAGGRYWICVRSAGGPKAKEKTHWVTMQMLQSDSKNTSFKSNIKDMPATTSSNQFMLPTNLGGTETEHLKYFAELMYLLQNPQEYRQNMGQGGAMASGLGALGTDMHADTTAHSPEYLELMARAWNEEDIWSKVLPPGVGREFFLQNEVAMLYNGYSTSLFGSGITLYQCTQSGTCRSDQRLTTPGWDKKDKTKYFDVREYAADGHATRSNVAGIGNSQTRAIVVCMCTGKELAGNWVSQPDYDKPIKGVKEVLLGRHAAMPYKAHYLPYSVYRDQYNRRWTCLAMAGTPAFHSRYAYFVSNDGFETSADNAYATNIADRNTMMHMMLRMMDLYIQLGEVVVDESVHYSENLPGVQAYNLKRFGHIPLDVLIVPHDTLPQLAGAKGRAYTASVAYRDGSTPQRYFRLIADPAYNTANKQTSHYYLAWTRYLQPNSRDRYGAAGAFTDRYIQTRDVADQAAVAAYADDVYTRLPLSWDDDGQRNAIRTSASPEAVDVRNFIGSDGTYNHVLGSMWREPVVFLRVAKALDLGEDNFSVTTTDGLSLTLEEAVYDDAHRELYSPQVLQQDARIKNIFERELFILNGMKFSPL